MKSVAAKHNLGLFFAKLTLRGTSAHWFARSHRVYSKERIDRSDSTDGRKILEEAQHLESRCCSSLSILRPSGESDLLTLIAMCCPFDDDLENQEIREIAKKWIQMVDVRLGSSPKLTEFQKGKRQHGWRYFRISTKDINSCMATLRSRIPDNANLTRDCQIRKPGRKKKSFSAASVGKQPKTVAARNNFGNVFANFCTISSSNSWKLRSFLCTCTFICIYKHCYTYHSPLIVLLLQWSSFTLLYKEWRTKFEEFGSTTPLSGSLLPTCLDMFSFWRRCCGRLVWHEAPWCAERRAGGR